MTPTRIGDATLYNGDCLEVMAGLPDGCIDLVFADVPHGTTACKWDSTIPLQPMWSQLKRLTKKRAAIVLSATQPFTSALVMSNPSLFKYDWIWKKNRSTNFPNAKINPLRNHESLLVFGEGPTTYNPQKTTGHSPTHSARGNSPQPRVYGPGLGKRDYKGGDTDRYPLSIQDFNCERGFHSTQKPITYADYFIRTYTNLGDTVLDFTMGSGTIGVSCTDLGRKFIGIENDTEHGYFNVAQARILEAYIRVRHDA